MADVARKMTSFRLSDDGRGLIVRLARRLGVSQSAVVEIAVRRLAQQEGEAPDANDKPDSHRTP